MYQKLCPSYPIKIKARMEWQPIALLWKQTRQITSRPDLRHSAIYRDFLYHFFLIEQLSLNTSVKPC